MTEVDDPEVEFEFLKTTICPLTKTLPPERKAKEAIFSICWLFWTAQLSLWSTMSQKIIVVQTKGGLVV